MELEWFVKLDLQQKAKIKWVIDGDENSRFFHGSLKHKKRKNRIHGLNINGEWNTDPLAIKSEIFNLFANKFRERWPNRPKFLNHNFKRISLTQSPFLESEFSIQEIKSIVWNCGGDKTPRPDGYTFKILKENWDTIDENIIRFVKYFKSMRCCIRM